MLFYRFKKYRKNYFLIYGPGKILVPSNVWIVLKKFGFGLVFFLSLSHLGLSIDQWS